ncbi:MAG: ADP-ribosylglycohydrolase family protein [Actinophytocola sp.]|uniref:ADP-ribosylglycohydrolase family protein n=1 Tax=Actinophytocola sp. TaxID=1872138 RepID=UPI003C74B27B
MIDDDRFLGCVLAGAVGDALGAPVEFLTIEAIRHRFGPDGTTGYEEAYGGRGTITDDTQMTLFTLEGLIRGHRGEHDDRFVARNSRYSAPMQHAYQRWLHTQGMEPRWADNGGVFATKPEPDGWLITNRGLFAMRAPGNTVTRALRAFSLGKPRGSFDNRLNDSKGCGAVMRAAPYALLGDDAFAFAVGNGLLTHGHPSGYLSAGALAHLVHLLLHDAPLPDAIAATRAELLTWDGHDEQVAALDAAVAHGRPTPESIADQLGGGWTGEEALAIAVAAALAAADMRDGLLLAVNHSGDSDSTGAICGNILGAMQGTRAIPPEWLAELELRAVIEQVTRDALAEFCEAPPDWGDRYPPT